MTPDNAAETAESEVFIPMRGIAYVASPTAFNVDPQLNPYHENHSSIEPKMQNVFLN